MIPLRTITRKEWGDLTIVEEQKDIPFKIRRIYYLHNIPSDCIRGSHGHRNLKQLMIAVRGSFTVKLMDGKSHRLIRLNSPIHGLFIPGGIWRELVDFSDDAVCMVLASEKYNEKDYIRDYNNFLKYKNYVPHKSIPRHC